MAQPQPAAAVLALKGCDMSEDKRIWFEERFRQETIKTPQANAQHFCTVFQTMAQVRYGGKWHCFCCKALHSFKIDHNEYIYVKLNDYFIILFSTD